MIKKPKIAIIGTKGITNVVGGYETMARKFADFSNKFGFELHIYGYESGDSNSYNSVFEHPIKLKSYLPNSQFFYDLESYLHAKDYADGIILCGYDIAPIISLFNDKRVVVNTDGIEWMRQSYPLPFRFFERFMEYLTSKSKLTLVSDSLFIKDYYSKRHGVNTNYIPYGFDDCKINSKVIEKYSLKINEYFVVSVRISPENGIDSIISSFIDSKIDSKYKLVILGNLDSNNAYHQKLKSQVFENSKERQIKFINVSVSDLDYSPLRGNCLAYVHGHTCGGTSPALVEAIGYGNFIIARDWYPSVEIIDSTMKTCNDDESLIKAFKEVVSSSPKSLSKLGQKLRKKRAKTFNWERLIKIYLALCLKEKLKK